VITVTRAYPAGYAGGNIRWAKIGGDPGYVRATSGHPNVLGMVQTLLGGPIKRKFTTKPAVACDLWVYF